MTLSADLAEMIVSRLKAQEPTPAAVLLAGSYARGDAAAYSDVDVVALTMETPASPFSTWYLASPDGKITHVSIAVEQLETPDEEAEDAAPWALGFAVLDVLTYLWRTPQAEAVLGPDPSECLPTGTPELEDFVELYMKVRRAVDSADTVLLRWAARLVGEYGVGLLRPLNPEVVVQSPVEALRAALALPQRPAHSREDFEVCTGLIPAPDAMIGAAAARLAREMLDYLQPRSAELELNDAGLEAALRDGLLRRYIEA